MIDYGEPPSDQMQLDLEGFTDDGKKLYEDAWGWIQKNPNAFRVFIQAARSKVAEGVKASPGYCLQQMRDRTHKSVPNAYSAPFARIAMSMDDTLRFRLAKSKVDGFCKVKIA